MVLTEKFKEPTSLLTERIGWEVPPTFLDVAGIKNVLHSIISIDLIFGKKQ